MLSARTLTLLSSIAAFLNTAPGPRGGAEQPERLTAGAQLADLVPALQEGDARLRVAAAAVVRAKDLRERLTSAWALAATNEAAATEGVNELLATVGPLRLVAGEEAVDFAPADTPSDAVERLTALAALAMAEAAVDGELSRLRVCAGEDCENALVDASRNRSKRFCDAANCANRTHVRSYRARLAEETAETPAPEAGGKAEPVKEDAPVEEPVKAEEGKAEKKAAKEAEKKARKKAEKKAAKEAEKAAKKDKKAKKDTEKSDD
ncbi:CGNR zinc finger domain-containing protein [Micrococcus sp. EYE_162]|uniref:CGNR zinc finger domain-containing protein n=1 Tax=unclassified Micrococcus TaxID=2620948 RepID=UPI002005575E|nr:MULTISPECIES: CGNR zinc finger domain-containing protein [unclassified Micrococcus]MCK6095005.1 CGNR zinc finger domain-containing protein [Micrococcus sp. EYE_212]MCK6170952.1 CGNR zinc finger domain-containing protein [Micrococcus sp. EYE_162]